MNMLQIYKNVMNWGIRKIWCFDRNEYFIFDFEGSAIQTTAVVKWKGA